MERLIYVGLDANSNKFWHGEVEGTTVKTNWGRVGATGQFKDYPLGSVSAAQAKLDTLVRGKLGKGYTRQATLGKETVVVKSTPKVGIQHNNDPETARLVDFLIQRNVHQIEATTTIRFDAQRLALTTPLGPVTSAGLDRAETLLHLMAAKDDSFDRYANEYLRIVPRDFGRHRITATDLFGTTAQMQAEQATLDALRAVIRDLEQKSTADDGVVPQWGTKLAKASKAEFDRIAKFFTVSTNRMHASSRLKLHAVWEMEIESMAKAYAACPVGNVRELWHGTKDANLLSILKTGYVIPRSGGSVAITGRMFGDGVYFSDQSTKSLNYAGGWAPGQRNGGSARTFMLLNDVKMGREYRPRTSFSGGIPSGYDSCYVKGGTASVMNNEMIVYNLNQINPRFLCEFR